MKPRLARIFKTFTFRLTLVYMGLFGVSVVILFSFIYTFAMNYMQGQVNDTIKMRYNYLQAEYHDSGTKGLEAKIGELIAGDDEGAEIYLLLNKEGEKIAGNLNEMPAIAASGEGIDKTGIWVDFKIEATRSEENNVGVRAFVYPLSKWRTLLVGRSTKAIERIQQTILQTFWASFFVTIFIALGGAVVMTRSVMHRINIINRSAHTIMHGNLSTRIPFTEGGDEFDELSSNLNQMLDKIEGLLASLGQFASNIAHDLRSPLNRIINRLEAGMRKLDNKNPARNLLGKNIHDMQELIGTFNSILKISELEANKDFREFATCNISRVMEDLVELYEPVAAEKDILLVNNIKEKIVIDGEKNLLTQAFANLLDNAIKFTEKGGKVEISSESGEDFLEIIIADNGIGIPENYMNKVFEKFFRLEQSRSTKGNGLGLSLVAAIARIHNAEIYLQRNERKGLQVHLRFSS